MINELLSQRADLMYQIARLSELNEGTWTLRREVKRIDKLLLKLAEVQALGVEK